MIDIETKNELIEKLVSNLPALRAKMRISQAELAEAVGIGRQTLVSIENRNGKMRWDTFLAIMLIISGNEEVADLLTFLGLRLQEVCGIIKDSISERKTSALQDRLWSDNDYIGDTTLRGVVPLPVGLRNSQCPKCHSKNIRGAIIMPTADEQDPNIICLDCGYWWD